MTIATRPPIMESPCQRICAVDSSLGLCTGCGRNLSEITHWIAYSDSERARIMAKLPARLAAAQRPKPG